MTKLLLDTTVHIQWSRNMAGIRDWLRAAILGADEIGTSVICMSEVYAGAHPKELDGLGSYFAAMDVLGIGPSIAIVAGRLRYHARQEGRHLHGMDALIAATALEIGATLVTSNAKDFQIPGLIVTEPPAAGAP